MSLEPIPAPILPCRSRPRENLHHHRARKRFKMRRMQHADPGGLLC